MKDPVCVHNGSWLVSGQHLGPLPGSLLGPDGAPLLGVQPPDERADGGPAHDVDGNPRLLHGLDDAHVGAASAQRGQIQTGQIQAMMTHEGTQQATMMAT